MDVLAAVHSLVASTTAPGGATVILPALAGAGLLIFLSQLFVPKQP